MGSLTATGEVAGSKPRADGNRESKGTAVVATAVSPGWKQVEGR